MVVSITGRQTRDIVDEAQLRTRARLALREVRLVEDVRAPEFLDIYVQADCSNERPAELCLGLVGVSIRKWVAWDSTEKFRPAIEPGFAPVQLCSVVGTDYGGSRSTLGRRILDRVDALMKSCVGNLRF